MKVLIVDDSKIVCEGLQQILAASDVEVANPVHNVHEAIRAISKYKPDVVILDIRMPGPSGMGVLKDIKDKMLPIVVIMLTNYPYPQYRKKCEELGAEYFIDKVTEIEKIPGIIEELKEKMSVNNRGAANPDADVHD